eukprot:346705-Chlamydomonas_euryale.AAC.1
MRHRQNDEDATASKKPRVVWSVDMHQQFVNAVNQLGVDKAVPKKILEIMKVRGCCSGPGSCASPVLLCLVWRASRKPLSLHPYTLLCLRPLSTSCILPRCHGHRQCRLESKRCVDIHTLTCPSLLHTLLHTGIDAQ